MSQLRQNQEQFDKLQAKIKLVAFDNEAMARSYASQTKLEWPVLLDCERKLYAHYGMQRGSWWSIYNPISVLRYLWLMLLGKNPGKPGEDWRQMGGDVLIDPDGIVQVHHVSTDPHDRPAVEFLLNKIERRK